jgi:hypothetical protein
MTSKRVLYPSGVPGRMSEWIGSDIARNASGVAKVVRASRKGGV